MSLPSEIFMLPISLRSIHMSVPPSQLVGLIRTLKLPARQIYYHNSIMVVDHTHNRIFNTAHEVVGEFGQRKLLGPSELTSDTLPRSLIKEYISSLTMVCT